MNVRKLVDSIILKYVGADDAHKSLKSGTIVKNSTSNTICDGTVAHTPPMFLLYNYYTLFY